MDKIIGIGEFKISDNRDDRLKTFALASCVAATFYSPSKKVAGMIHFALPEHHELDDGQYKQGFYASLGVPKLIEKMLGEYGCIKSDLVVQLFGGAKSVHENDFFNIGEKNIQAAKNILDQYNIKISKADVGGYISRTVAMDVHSGNITIVTQPIKI